MSTIKLSNELISQIRQLNDVGKNPKDIAQELGLKRLQVVAILAHEQLQNKAELEVKEDEQHVPTEPAIDEEPLGDIAGSEDISGRLVNDWEAEDGIYVGDDKDYGDLCTGFLGTLSCRKILTL